MNTVFVEQVQA